MYDLGLELRLEALANGAVDAVGGDDQVCVLEPRFQVFGVNLAVEAHLHA